MRRNCQNTTFSIKSDHAVQSGMPKNLCVRDIVAKQVILWVFVLVEVKFLPHSLQWRFCKHARETGKCCPILTPNELVLTILVQKTIQKFVTIG